MAKTFNITGSCSAGKHYMADISQKLARIEAMIAKGDYFTINKPRQFGKTTLIHSLEQRLSSDDDYLALGISFEEIDAPTYEKQEKFIATFIEILKEQIEYLGETDLLAFVGSGEVGAAGITNFKQLDLFLTKLIDRAGRKAVLLIDEVDKACNNQLFLDFLGMLRAKFLKRNQGKGRTFHSVILAGVHDVKTLKIKIRSEDDRLYNSPWNIAVDFDVELSFTADEIAVMLETYARERGVTLDIPLVAERLFYYTSGHPFLVSYLCKIIDEELLPRKDGGSQKEWLPEDLPRALQAAISKESTNFESLIKNLQNNGELYDFVFEIIMNGREFAYNRHNPLIHSGEIHGVLKKGDVRVKIHNRVYEQVIYNYMASRLETSVKFDHAAGSYLDEKGALSIEKVLRKFQAFMLEQHSRKDEAFLERNGRLLFLAFLRPIINGKGFDFKEVQVSEEKRLDIVVSYGAKKHIIELKVWRGETYHQAGITQLCDYLERQALDSGYLIIYDFRKKSDWAGKSEVISLQGKTIFAVWV